MANTSSSVSAPEAAILTTRLRSYNEDITNERHDRSPMASLTPKRRGLVIDEEDFNPKSGRTPTADASTWHSAFSNSKTDSKWWRNRNILIPAGLLLLLIGFIAGRSTGISSQPIARMSSQGAYTDSDLQAAMKSPSLQKKMSGASGRKDYQAKENLVGSKQETSAKFLEDSLESDADFIQADLESAEFNPDAAFHTSRGKSGPEKVIVEKKLVSQSQAKAKADIGSGKVGIQVGSDSKKFVAEKPVKYATNLESEASLSTKIGPQHIRIYIAELPAKYNTDPLEAIFNLGSTKPKSAKEAASAVVSNPFGRLVGSETDMLYTTHPHNLDVLFYTILQNSPLRASKPEEADAILVPFWLNKFIKLDQELEKPNRHDLAYGNFWSEVNSHLPFLGQKPHILIVPGQEDALMSTCGGSGLDFLCQENAKHFTILTPELFIGTAGNLYSNQIAPGLITQGFKPSNRSIAIPDFANIHFSEAIGKARSIDSASMSRMKTRTVSEAFRARAPLRKLLRSQCMKHADQCVHMEPQMLHSHNAGAFSQTVMQNDKSAWFSLQPPGDSAMRTSLYNSILAGAIPAVFDDQLGKVLPFSDSIQWDQLVIQISPEKITKKGQDIVELLEVTLYDDAFTMALKAAFKTICTSDLAPKKCKSTESNG